MRAVDNEITLSGVNELALGRHASTEELTALDERGYVVVPALLSEDDVERLRTEFDRLVAEDPRAKVDELGTLRAKGTIDNEALALCWRHRVVLESAAHVIGTTFHVSQVHLRDPNPGNGSSDSTRIMDRHQCLESRLPGSSTHSRRTTGRHGSCRARTDHHHRVLRFRSLVLRFRSQVRAWRSVHLDHC